jgi:hypothetical protein
MLLAQAAEPSPSLYWLLTATSAGVALLGVLVFFFVLLFRHLRSVRQLTHLERMRSLEAGFPLEAPEEMKIQAKFVHNAFWISFWLVFSVPAAAFSAASAATAKVNASVGLLAVIWIGTAMASIVAVAGATVLMLNTRPRKGDDEDGMRKPTKLM